MNKKFLITGHPRCGTGFMANLLQSYGVNIGHEVMGGDGISCCFYTSKNKIPKFASEGLKGKVRQDWTFDYVINNVRDPFTAIPSIYFTNTPTQHNKNHWAHNFMLEDQNFRKEILGISDENIFNFVVLSYLGWNDINEKNGYDFRVKIEDTTEFEEFLTINGYKKIREPNKNYNTRKNDKNIDYGEFPWDNVSGKYIEKLEIFCEKNGYESIKERI